MTFEEEIKTALPRKALERWKNVTLLESVDSTNNFLKNMAGKGIAPYGHCVIADFQSSGRGRLGRSFSSPRGKGIYLSYLMSSHGIPIESMATITAYVAVCVREAIFEVCGIEAGIKWVNDIVYGGKKICGILTETSRGESSGIIIGIGVNVNHVPEDFPSELSDIATSLKMISGKEHSRGLLCSAIIKKLDTLCSAFPSDKDYYLSEYRKHCDVSGKRVRVIKDGEERLGTAVGISDDFGFIADFDDGRRETLTAGEVSVRGFYGYI